jgi:hypothetical protein
MVHFPELLLADRLLVKASDLGQLLSCGFSVLLVLCIVCNSCCSAQAAAEWQPACSAAAVSAAL